MDYFILSSAVMYNEVAVLTKEFFDESN